MSKINRLTNAQYFSLGKWLESQPAIKGRLTKNCKVLAEKYTTETGQKVSRQQVLKAAGMAGLEAFGKHDGSSKEGQAKRLEALERRFEILCEQFGVIIP